MDKNLQTTTLPYGSHIGNLITYVSGFIFSILLTFFAYILVVNHSYKGFIETAALIILAVVQLIIQLVFFLHLDHKSKSRWNLLIMCLMLIIVLIIVIGSIWIMNNLNYRMTPQQINQYMNDQSGI